VTARRLALAAVCAVALLSAPAAAGGEAKPPRLLAGVGRADITPPTGYALGGWTRADRVSEGVHTRLQASVLVLKSGKRKLALAAVDLFAAPGGLVAEAAEQAGHGFSERNVIVSASHTHSGPSQFANFATLNTLAPSAETITDPQTFVDFLSPRPAEPEIYTFLVERLAVALRRANRDLAPAAAAWGTTRLLGVTENRSLEAHLADHGVQREFGEGAVAQDPRGYEHTIDPLVSVLRVDRLRGGRRVPIGGWSTFANHGTVNPPEYEVYTQDHHGAALRISERAIRRAGDVARRRPVVNVFGNSNEGDQSAGLHGQGPSIAERVGRREARAMVKAWRKAGARLRRRPELDLRWTRTCFCGQQTTDGRVADEPVAGVPFLTGSEENRGPLFDVTGVPFEGRRAAVAGFESQGHKIGIPFATSTDTYPSAVPLFVVRIADRLIITMPGEATVEVGRRARARVMAAIAGSGIRGVAVSGLANEFIQYITTPEEYDRQHYEGGSTMYGPAESAAITDSLVALAEALGKGEAAPAPAPFDPRNGVEPDGEPYGTGAERGTTLAEPLDVPPGAQAVFEWQGAPRGLDRPLDRRFIAIERRFGDRWRRVADDLGLAIVWTVDDAGRYDVHWQVPRQAKPGAHRVVVTANNYRLRSRPFGVDRAASAADTDPTHPASLFAPITNR
jgi:hypothetical protein